MYLTSYGEIETKRFEIYTSCSSWFELNVKQQEEKSKEKYKNHYYHEYKGKKVIGYICSDNLPQ